MADPWKRKEVIGDCTLYLGDCLEILPTFGSVDTVVTDPPYGIDLGGDGGMWAGVKIAGDADVSVRDAVLAMAAAPFAAFASPRRPEPPKTRATVVWDKGEHTGAGDLSLPWKPSFELVHIGGRGWHAPFRSGGIVRVNAVAGLCVGNRNDGKRFHPFEKPIEIMHHFCMRAPGDTILDPFMGSGTTGVACVKLGRRFIGIEIDEGYFDTACKRIRDAYAQPDMFIERPAPAVQLDMLEGGDG